MSDLYAKVANSLKDPLAAQFRNDSTCEKGTWSASFVKGGIEYGWIQTGEVNGKNAFGGYVGFKPYKVIIRDGIVYRFCIANSLANC